MGNAIPTMAISTIKLDEHGNPKRCKYHIVVLGNLDLHSWNTTDCFAPILSQLEFCLLLTIAVHNRVIPKQGDAHQAFIPSTLPPDEQYIVRPPTGCPLTNPNTSLKLIRT